jgi:hypothetical protein
LKKNRGAFEAEEKEAKTLIERSSKGQVTFGVALRKYLANTREE